MSGLVATDLHLAHGSRPALDGVSARFGRGRVTALLGPNGAGKSSLLALLAGLLAPDAGTVTLDGVAVTAMPPRDRARAIGLLPQGQVVHWNMDVATLVGLGRLPHRGRGGADAADRAAVARAIAATDTGGLASRGVDTLSGGERARVLLARVLAGEPDWLLADEPLASLDPAHQLDILARLRDVAGEGAGVVIVLHDLNHAARVADDVLLLAHGRVVAAGPTEAVLAPGPLAQAFGIQVERARGEDGRPWLLPTGRL